MDSISGSISHGRREAFDRWLDAVEAHLREYEAEQVRERKGQLVSAAQLTEMEQTFAVVGRGSGQAGPNRYSMRLASLGLDIGIFCDFSM